VMSSLRPGVFTGGKIKVAVVQNNPGLTALQAGALSGLPDAGLVLKTPALQCCGHDWLIYDPILDTGVSEVICAGPDSLRGLNMLDTSGDQSGWTYDAATEPAICGCLRSNVSVGVSASGDPQCACECPDRWALRGTAGEPGGVCVQCQHSNAPYVTV
jgi:hypothetical protein